MDFQIRPAQDPPDLEAIRTLWQEYWASFQLSPDFQGFAEELRNLPGVYAAPEGLLLMAHSGAVPAGCIALRRLSAAACEAKRLYVRPDFRGQGLARALLQELLRRARSLGYQTLYGDSLPAMTGALSLYRSFGFRQTGPYSAHPTPGAIYLELPL